jgi:hypothetical protein
MEYKTGLWEKEGKNGPYYSGNVEINGQKHWVNVFINDRKTEDRHPDMNLLIKQA